MRPHGPWVISLTRSHYCQPDHIPVDYRLIWRDFNRDISYFAPRGIAWLYRWLPMAGGFRWGRLREREQGSITDWRVWIEAPNYGFAWRRDTGLLSWWPGKRF